MRVMKAGCLIIVAMFIAAAAPTLEKVQPFANGFKGPENLTFDGKGSLYVTDTNHLYKLNMTGKKEIIYTRAKADRLSLCGVKIGPRGKVFFSAGNRILVYKPGTGSISEFAKGFGLANGIAFDDKGDLFVADSIKSKIYVIPVNSRKKRTLKSFEAWADGLVWDRKDNTLYYTTTYSGKLCGLKLDENLKVVRYFTIAKFHWRVLDDIAFDADGNIIVCQWGDGKIVKVTHDGKKEVLAEGIDGPSAAAFGLGDMADTLFICVQGGNMKFKGTQLVTIKVGMKGYRIPFLP